jgi:hypothetical protein
LPTTLPVAIDSEYATTLTMACFCTWQANSSSTFTERYGAGADFPPTV